MRTIDLFSGAGGFSTGAVMAGAEVVWAANHWQLAVDYHAKNHPLAAHVCQDLHQANWAEVPGHDILLAAPCCQGHSNARGRENGNPQHDASRSTANAVVDAVEFCAPSAFIVENVPEFLQWVRYPSWAASLESLGYSLAPHILDAADHGVPQHRVRMFLIGTKSKAPLQLNLPKQEHIPASSFIDFNAGRWSKVRKPGRAASTLQRIEAGRAIYGDRFIAPYYGSGSGKTGRCLSRPIGTIPTRDRWAVVDGERMRMLSKAEGMAAMGFPDDYQLPAQHKTAMHLMGNAVCPPMAAKVIKAVMERI